MTTAYLHLLYMLQLLGNLLHFVYVLVFELSLLLDLPFVPNI